MVVARESNDAAMRMRAEQVGMLERIAGPVHARPLAVPDAEDAVIFRVAEETGLLRSPDGSRGEVLVDTRLEDDMVVLKMLACRP